jgi:hypothetical protein
MPGARGKSRREERTRRCSICLGERFGIVAWDEFAATLLMPLDDSRRQITPKGQPNFDELSACATRYNVSLAAVILRWLRYTDRRAMIVVSRDGFMKWAWSSEPAFRGSPSRRWRKRLGECALSKYSPSEAGYDRPIAARRKASILADGFYLDRLFARSEPAMPPKTIPAGELPGVALQVRRAPL